MIVTKEVAVSKQDLSANASGKTLNLVMAILNSTKESLRTFKSLSMTTVLKSSGVASSQEELTVDPKVVKQLTVVIAMELANPAEASNSQPLKLKLPWSRLVLISTMSKSSTESTCRFPSAQQTLQDPSLTNVELQVLNTLTLNSALATGTSSLLPMITTGLQPEELIASKIQNARAELKSAVSVSTLVMLTFFKRLAEDSSVTGLPIRSAASFPTTVLPSTAMSSSQLQTQDLPTGISMLALVSALATNQALLKAAVVV